MAETHMERVLVVPTQLLHNLGYFQGFSADADRYLDELQSPRNASYRQRSEMEQDPSFKQLIPYVIFRHTDRSGRVSIFHYTRGVGQGEARLHRKRSVGIGGHICVDDAGTQDPYSKGMQRELDEEVIIETPYRERCVGLINDDQTEVGKVHLGVVHLLDVEQPNVRPRESEIVAAGFAPPAELMGDIESFESWSKFCLNALFANS